MKDKQQDNMTAQEASDIIEDILTLDESQKQQVLDLIEKLKQQQEH